MNMNTNSDHVIFGTGPLGFATMEALRKRGLNVKMFNRSGKRGEIPTDVPVNTFDVNSADSVRNAAKGARVVYMCAQPEYTEWTEKFPPMIKAVIDGLDGTGMRLVMGDNQYMYGEFTGALTEDHPMNPHTKKGKVRLLLNNMLMDAHKSGKLQVAFGRGADFYGPRALGSLIGETFFVPLLKGKNVSIYGNIDTARHFTYINDFGELLANLGTHDDVYGQAWFVPHYEQTTFRKFADTAFQVAGMPAKYSKMGDLMVRVGGLFIPEAREMIEMMYEMEQPYLIDSSKATRKFGQQGTPLNTAMKATVDWFRHHITEESKSPAKA